MGGYAGERQTVTSTLKIAEHFLCANVLDCCSFEEIVDTLSGVTELGPEEQLMSDWIEGDRDAFRILFGRLVPMVRAIMWRAGVSKAEVDELVQQCFLQVHRARADFEPGRAVRPWVAAIAVNVRRDFLRKHQRRPQGYRADQEELDALPAAGNEDEHAAVLEAKRVRQAVQQLPDKLRIVIELHWFGGLTFAEVAVALGVGESAAKVRAHRAYGRLRLILEEEQ